MRKNLIVIFLFFGFVLLSGCLTASAATRTVDNTSDNGALTACTSAANDCSLRGAMIGATAGDIIDFAALLFDAAQTITLTSGTLLIDKNLSINGRGANLTTVSGNNTSRVFRILGVTATLSGLSITNGFDPSQGGGISNDGTLTIADCAVSGNSVNGGSDNNGGGIYNGAFATLTITGSTISGNSVSGSGNFSNRGGGIVNDNGFLTIKNSTVSGNSASGGTNNRGGGIYSQFRDLIIIGVTITDNSVGGSGFSYGGGVFTTQDTVTLRNTIISGNSAPNNPNLFGSLNTSNYNLIDADARLAPLGFYGGTTQTHAVLHDSPAVNAGNPSYDPIVHGATDQRGSQRLAGGRIDIGAFENIIDLDQSDLPNGSTGVNYSRPLSATRQTNAADDSGMRADLLAPSQFSLVSMPGEQLPPGLSLSAGGLISGTPTLAGTYAFTIKATDADGMAGVRQLTIQILAPTAAAVSISGKILTADGQGLSNARVILTDSSGNSRTVSTGSFGFYRFDDVAAGQTYVVTVAARRLSFAPRIISVFDNITELNFAPNE